MSPDEAMSFIEWHGIVLASAKGPVPSLAAMLVGEPIKGSWWAHPKGHLIFSTFESIADAPDILSCRLIDGKVTYVHRRLWPALIRAAEIFPVKNLARVDQEHTAAGHHIKRETPFPDWADADSKAMARRLSEQEALAALGDWAAQAKKRSQ
jgi:phosphoketolase